MSFYESTLLNCANPCRNFTFQRFAIIAEKKERNGTNQNLTLTSISTQVLGLSRRCTTHYVTGASRQNQYINPYELSNLKLVPSLSFLHVDHSSKCCSVNSVHNCPQFIPIFYIAVSLFHVIF